LNESPDETRGGLPEEHPGEPSPSEDESPRESGKAPRKHDDKAEETDHGKATGNPRSAG
jgi:hypothetical protein